MIEIAAHLDIASGQRGVDEYLGCVAQDGDVATLAGFDEFLRQCVIVLRLAGDGVLAELYLFRIPADDADLFKVEGRRVFHLRDNEHLAVRALVLDLLFPDAHVGFFDGDLLAASGAGEHALEREVYGSEHVPVYIVVAAELEQCRFHLQGREQFAGLFPDRLGIIGEREVGDRVIYELPDAVGDGRHALVHDLAPLEKLLDVLGEHLGEVIEMGVVV